MPPLTDAREHVPPTSSPSGDNPTAAKRPRPRQLVSSACQACREKRVKCDGPPAPCEACLQRNTPCVFNVHDDQRRRLARKHKADEADFHQRLLHGLLETMRSSEEAQIRDMIRVVQSGAPLTELMDVIERSLEDALKRGSAGQRASEELRELRLDARELHDKVSDARERHSGDLEPVSPDRPEGYWGGRTAVASDGTSSGPGSTPRESRKVLSISQLMDTVPEIDVPARPWTTVIDSDRTVSHFISLYFAWCYPFWRVLDHDAFVDAMKGRDINSPLCSPFLVNAILAVATQLCVAQAFMEDGDFYMRGEKFHDEAQRLWIAEHGHVSLTNIQGLYHLILSEDLRGRDKAGWAQSSQLWQMYNDLALSRRMPRLKPMDTPTAARMQQSWRIAGWGVFNMSMQSSLTFLKPSILEPPAWGLPFTDAQAAEAYLWSPYPRKGALPAPRNSATNALCELLHHALVIPRRLFQEPASLKIGVQIEETNGVVDALIGWRARLPAILRPSAVAAPCVFELHMQYFSIMITLFGITMRSETPPLKQTQSRPRNLHMERTLALIREVMQQLTAYHQAYGYGEQPVAMLHVAVASANTLLRCLNSDENRAMFSELVTVMIAAGRMQAFWQGTVLMLRRTAQELGVVLPAGDESRLVAFERAHWPSQDHHGRRFHSQYPNFAMAMGAQEEEDFQMGELLEHWMQL